MDDLKVDSKEGITALLDFARNGSFVLDARHKRIADHYGVPTDGVVFSLPIPSIRFDPPQAGTRQPTQTR